jgi:hypothetical protein
VIAGDGLNTGPCVEAGAHKPDVKERELVAMRVVRDD